MATKQQTEVNEVPLSETLQAAANKFLRAAKDNEWDDDDSNSVASALVIVFRNGDDRVHANVLNEGLGDDYQKLMADAALKAIAGKPLFYEVYEAK